MTVPEHRFTHDCGSAEGEPHAIDCWTTMWLQHPDGEWRPDALSALVGRVSPLPPDEDPAGVS